MALAIRMEAMEGVQSVHQPMDLVVAVLHPIPSQREVVRLKEGVAQPTTLERQHSLVAAVRSG